MSKIADLLFMYGFKLIGAVVIFVIGKWVAGWLTNLVKRMMGKAEVNETLIKFTGNLLYIGLLAFVIIAALNNLGVQTASFIAVLGAAGLAVGLALQGSLSNFAAGVMLIIFRPFKVGDYVEAGGTSGSVHEIQIFNTILKTPDRKTVILPNSTITSGKIVNYSTEPVRRVDMVFGIGYDDDLKKAKQILVEMLENDTRVLKDPAPVVVVSELGDSSVNFAVRPHVNAADYWPLFFDFHEQVKLKFDEEGISIPFPQRDVHLYEEKKMTESK